MSWARQQTRFAKALSGPDLEVPDFVCKTAGGPSQQRLNVYRNNIMVSLVEAMLDSYPVVTQLTGEEFATAMARVYVGENPPTSPVLFEYGGDFGDFIENFAPAASLPFLSDVARLESAWLTAFHSADCQPLGIEGLGEYHEDAPGGLRFSFCPSVHLLRSPYPVVSIWSAHQGDEIDEVLLAKAEGEEYALVNRPRADVVVRSLTRATFAFFTTLQAGHTLATAIDKGNCCHDFDPAAAISALFEAGVVAEIKE